MGKLLKKLIQILFSSLLMILLTACGSDKGEKSNEDISQEEDLIGEVVIKLEGKTYKLELAKCWRPKGQNIFLIHSKKIKISQKHLSLHHKVEKEKNQMVQTMHIMLFT